MRKSRSEIIDIVKTGANLIISAEKLTRSELIDIINAAPQGTEITIIDTINKTRSELIDISNAAGHISLTLHL